MTDRIVETRLSALGYAMVPRADGNGAEVGGVSQDVMDLFSSRSRALTPELKALIGQYQKAHGKPPSKRTIWLLGQQAAQNTRRTKAEARRTVAGQAGTAEPTEAQRLAAWEAQTARREVQALSAVHQEVARFAAEHAGRAPAVLDDAAKRKAARIAVAEVQQHHAVWSMAQLRFEVHRALPVLQAEHGCRGAGHRGGQAGRLRPGRDRGHPGHRAGPHRRDQPGGAGLRRGQHLPAAERGTVLHPGPPGHRTADPHRRDTDRAAAGQPPSRPGRPPSAPG